MVDIWTATWSRQMGSSTRQRWRTERTEAEMGSMQLRKAWTTSITYFTLQINALDMNNDGDLTDSTFGDMYNFYRAMGGSATSFYYRDTKDNQATAVTLSGSGHQEDATMIAGTTDTILKDDGTVFSTDDEFNTNFEAEMKTIAAPPPAVGEEKQITDTVGGAVNTVTLASALTGTPAVADVVTIKRNKWQLRQNYIYEDDGVGGTANNYEDKYYPISGTLTVSVGGGGYVAPGATYAVDADTGVITFTDGNEPANAAAVLATFEYHHRCHFQNDSMSYQEFSYAVVSGNLVLEVTK